MSRRYSSPTFSRFIFFETPLTSLTGGVLKKMNPKQLSLFPLRQMVMHLSTFILLPATGLSDHLRITYWHPDTLTGLFPTYGWKLSPDQAGLSQIYNRQPAHVPISRTAFSAPLGNTGLWAGASEGWRPLVWSAP